MPIIKSIAFSKIAVYMIFLFILFSAETIIHAQYTFVTDSINKLNTFKDKFRYTIGAVDELKIFDSELKLHQFYNALVKTNDIEFLNHVEYRKNHYLVTNDTSLSIRISKINKVLKENIMNGNLFFEGNDYHHLAQDYFEAQKFGYAFENYHLAYNKFEEIGFENVPQIDMFLHDYALANYYFKNYEEVIRLMYISLKFPPCNKRHHIQRYNNIAMSYFHLNKIDSALVYLNKTKETAYQYNDNDWIGISLGNIGNLYYKNGNFELALEFYKKQHNYTKNSQYEPPVISSCLKIAKAYLALDSTTTSNYYLNVAELALNNLKGKRRYGEIQQLESLKSDFYQTKSHYLVKTNELEKAIEYRDSFADIKNKIEKEYNIAIVKLSADKVIIANSKLDIAKITQKKTILNIIYLIIIIFVVSVSAFVSFKINKLRKINKLEAEKLSEKNIKIQQKIQEIETELSNSENTLSQFKLKVLEQNETIELFEQSIQQLTQEQSASSIISEKKNALETLKTIRILTDADWVNFLSSFKNVYPDLSKAINNNVPIFTTSETRYLMLSKLGFNNKEMAGISGVSEGAIRITWKRIREKLNLNSKISPIAFINMLENNNASNITIH